MSPELAKLEKKKEGCRIVAVWAESSGRVEQSLLCNFLSAQIGRAAGCRWAQHNNLARHYLSLGISGCCAVGLCLPLLRPSPPPLQHTCVVNPAQAAEQPSSRASCTQNSHALFRYPCVALPLMARPQGSVDAGFLVSQEVVPNKMKLNETFIDRVNSTQLICLITRKHL